MIICFDPQEVVSKENNISWIQSLRQKYLLPTYTLITAEEIALHLEAKEDRKLRSAAKLIRSHLQVWGVH